MNQAELYVTSISILHNNIMIDYIIVTLKGNSAGISDTLVEQYLDH